MISFLEFLLMNKSKLMISFLEFLFMNKKSADRWIAVEGLP